MDTDNRLPIRPMPKDIVFWNAFCRTPHIDRRPAVMYRTIGPYKLAHSVRPHGFTAQVIDFATLLTEDELFECSLKFIDHNTQCLAISTTYILDSITNHSFDSKLIAVLNRITAVYPKLNIVFGGYGIGVLKKDLHQLAKKQIILVSQFGENIIVDLMNYFKGSGPRPRFEIESDPTKTTTIHVYSTAITTTHDIQTDNFRFVKEDCIQPNETLPIEISRGCIFKCKFCNHLLLGRGKLDYIRDFDLIKEEMLYNYQNFGTTNYYVICDTFNDTEHKMKAWYSMIMSLPFKIQYTAYLRADLLDRFPDTPYMLKESGLVSAYHGIETLGPEASVSIGKGWSGRGAREYIPKLYHDIWNKEVYQTISLIAGLPGDTREILLDTAHWARDNDLYNIVWHTLGLSAELTTKNASEFERNSAMYGYELNTNLKSMGDWRWKTAYWNNNEVNQYLTDTLRPIIDPISSQFSSWSILQLLQYKIPLKAFKKKNLQLITPIRIGIAATQWLTAYKNAIRDL